MSLPAHQIELLSPARTADIGIEAVNHGADAVYIGGPSFGARSSAENSVQDIARLVTHAHRYNSRIFLTLNTILRDDELEAARRLCWQAYDAGVDALIIQDMGLLEIDLPPIQLHASTQTDIRTPEKARFLQDAGLSQIVLARELTLEQIRDIRAQTHCALEFFVHGALCVAYSGQCYISHAHTGRSANRGECSQACRLPYDLENEQGQVIAGNQHLLSMKDNDQSANLLALARAGIASFKIEGRLKDLAYVKNITAHYRTLLDRLLADQPQFSRASAGRSSFGFTPRPEKTFNRGATDYFVHGRGHSDVGAFATPAFAGPAIGTVSRLGQGWFEVDLAEAEETLHNGDGLAYFDTAGTLVGMRLNTAEKAGPAWRCTPQEVPGGLAVGTTMHRNRDQEFERLLEKKSAERRIGVTLVFAETPEGFALTLEDETGIDTTATLAHAKEAATNGERALAGLRDNLGKLGNTLYAAESIELRLSQPWFLPAAAVNALRREAVDRLDAARAAAYRRPLRGAVASPPALYPEVELTYLGNVLNRKAQAFYRKHGVELIAEAYEADREKGAVSLMITKHCLRHSFNLCPKEVKGLKPDPLTLVNNGERLTLKFDCVKCEMHVVGKARKNRSIQIVAR